MYFPILAGQPFSHAVGKCVCVGRNYAEHAKELNNPIPQSPILFLKPADAVVALSPSFAIPTHQGSVHHELEIAVLIGKKIYQATSEEAMAAIAGVGLALDLTLRDVQSQLKEKGHPWEIAKAFDGACPVSEFITPEHILDWHNLPLSLIRNGQIQQQGNSAEMLFPIAPLLATMSQHFTLNPGDLVLTGTPAGVGPIEVGDVLTLQLGDWLGQNCTVTARSSLV